MNFQKLFNHRSIHIVSAINFLRDFRTAEFISGAKISYFRKFKIVQQIFQFHVRRFRSTFRSIFNLSNSKIFIPLSNSNSAMKKTTAENKFSKNTINNLALLYKTYLVFASPNFLKNSESYFRVYYVYKKIDCPNR